MAQYGGWSLQTVPGEDWTVFFLLKALKGALLSVMIELSCLFPYSAHEVSWPVPAGGGHVAVIHPPAPGACHTADRQIYQFPARLLPGQQYNIWLLAAAHQWNWNPVWGQNPLCEMQCVKIEVDFVDWHTIFHLLISCCSRAGHNVDEWS